MNENNLNKWSFATKVVLGIVLIVVILGGIYLYTSKKVDAPVVDENNSEVLGNKEDLVSFSVKAGDTVSGMLNLSGSVKNAYFFEGNILISLLDSNQNVLKQGYGTATTDWMTTEPISFTSSIDSTGLNGSGFILIQNDDPSDGEGGPAKKIFIPVIFYNINKETMSVKLFFPNKIFNPESFDCSLVYSVDRIIPYTQAVATATLNELIKGPTAEEEKNGYFGVIPDGTKINSIKIENGILSVDFSKEVQSGGGSCSMASRTSSLSKTISQFSTVKSIKISVEGNSNQSEIFQP